MIKGSISLEDAQLVHSFASDMEHLLPANFTQQLERARTVKRIAYFSMADIRQKIRSERAKHSFE